MTSTLPRNTLGSVAALLAVTYIIKKATCFYKTAKATLKIYQRYRYVYFIP
jgi:hypothetical protein